MARAAQATHPNSSNFLKNASIQVSWDFLNLTATLDQAILTLNLARRLGAKIAEENAWL